MHIIDTILATKMAEPVDLVAPSSVTITEKRLSRKRSLTYRECALFRYVKSLSRVELDLLDFYGIFYIDLEKLMNRLVYPEDDKSNDPVLLRVAIVNYEIIFEPKFSIIEGILEKRCHTKVLISLRLNAASSLAVALCSLPAIRYTNAEIISSYRALEDGI